MDKYTPFYWEINKVKASSINKHNRIIIIIQSRNRLKFQSMPIMRRLIIKAYTTTMVKYTFLLGRCVVALKRAGLFQKAASSLLGAGVFGDGLGAFRHGVLGQFTGEEKTDGSLDLPAGDGGSFVVMSQTR